MNNREAAPMKRSMERILTTHVGSLPRPVDLRAMWAKKSSAAEDEAALQSRLRSAIGEVVLAQQSAGIDIPNDGEFGKPMRAATDRGAWGNYIFDRLSGFTATSAQTIAPDTDAPGAAMRIVGVRWEQREFAEFYADTGLGAPSTAAMRPTCTGPIAYTAQTLLREQLANLKAAIDAAGIGEAFVSAIAPGSLEMFCRDQNSYYPTTEKFLEAIGAALREEYRAIIDAGFILQLDDPGLPGAWDMLDPRPSVEEYRRYAIAARRALEPRAARNSASSACAITSAGAAGMVRIPLTFRLRDIVDIMLRVNAQAYLLEAGNVRHEHEYKVWRDIKLPPGRFSFPAS